MSQVHDGNGKLVGRSVSVVVRNDEEEHRLVEAARWASGKWVKPTTKKPPVPGAYRLRGGAFVERDRLWVMEGQKPSRYGFCTWLGADSSWQVFVLECEREGAEMWSQPDPGTEP